MFSLYNPIKFVAILYPTSQANLVVEMGILWLSSVSLIMLKDKGRQLPNNNKTE